MPRQARLDAPGTLHHVIVRGIEKRRKELRMGSRRGRICQVRSQIAYELVEQYGLPLAEVARQLGVTTSAISKAINRITKT